MTRQKRFSLRLLSVVIAMLLFTGVSWARPSIDVAASTVCITPFGYPLPDDEGDG